MMSEHGPAGLTLSDVARRAGVNRGTAYQHFATRDEVVAAVLDNTFGSAKATLDPGGATTLEKHIDQTVQYFVDHPEVVRLSLFRLLDGIPNPREDLWSDYLGRLRDLVGDGQPGVDADMLAVILLWSMRVQTGAERPANTSRYLRELKRLLLFGVVRPEHHPDLARAVRGTVKPGPTKLSPRAKVARGVSRGRWSRAR
jgi:AcrR family transcriptional regulator